MTPSTLSSLLRSSLHTLYPDREIESIGRLVLEHLTGLSWVQIRLNPDILFTAEQESEVEGIIDRLIHHEPIQYILGETEFYGLKFRVRPGVLIPRGETEELADWVIKVYGSGEGRIHAGPSNILRVLDIGCGSGAIAIALAVNLPGAVVFAADISEEALSVTKENANLNKLEVNTLVLDILADEHPGIQGVNFDVIVSNPPYVPRGEMTAMDAHVVEFEPEMALFVPDNDPLLFYRAIAEFASVRLNPGGQVFVEIHDRLGEETAGLFRKLFTNVELRKDIHGKDRMIRAYHG